jgi:hypothetical protein
MTRSIAAAMSIAIAACAGVTDVVPVGDGVYLVTGHGITAWSADPAHKAAALQKAAEFCSGMGKQLQTISSSDSGPTGFGTVSSAEVQFRCVNPAATVNP